MVALEPGGIPLCRLLILNQHTLAFPESAIMTLDRVGENVDYSLAGESESTVMRWTKSSKA